MTNLTEQWKKGELPDGWYWVEGSRAEGIYAYTAEYLNNMYRPRNGERIIEQVPSFEEWKAKQEENTKLKKLLYENRQKMFKAEKNYGFDDSIIEILTPQMDKIDKLLGDK